MNLWAVIVTYNRLAALQHSLPRMLAEEVDGVLVVDNASTDGTGDWLAARAEPRLEVLRLAENLGGAGGFEAGLRTLMGCADSDPGKSGNRFSVRERDTDSDPRKSGNRFSVRERDTDSDPRKSGSRFSVRERDPSPSPPDWICLLDDDAWPERGAMAAFRARAAGLDPDAPGGETPGVIAAAVRHPDGTLSEMNRCGLNPFWHLAVFLAALGGGRAGFHLRDADFAADAPPRDVDVASFVGFFVSRGAVARGGLPDPGLFIYGDDLLYSLRLRKAGVPIRLDPAIRFRHDCATMGTGYHYRPLWKIYYHCRNGVSIAWHAAGPVVFPAALAYYLTVWWRRSRHVPAPDRPLYRRLLIRGVRDGLMGRRGRNDAVHRLER